MTLEQFHALQNEEGARLLAELAGESLDESVLLPLVERYRRRYPPALVSAAVELASLRRHAAGKFSAAGTMFFTRDGLEMASSEIVARYVARRFTGLPLVFDLCCGIGGEALALAAAARRVVAVDRDPLALTMARANARVAGVHDRVDFMQADVTAFAAGGAALLPRPSAIYIDPSRRSSPGAANRPEQYSPPLSWCLTAAAAAPRGGIKAAPALDYDGIRPEGPIEIEVISLRGECKELLLWLGGWRSCARRATLLPGTDTLTDAGPTSDAIGDIGRWICEPDPAVIRAHLVQRLAGELDWRRIDADIAYLTGDRKADSPFATGYAVDAVIPWSLKRVNTQLAARGIGQVVIKKRGFPLTPEALRPKLKLTGRAHAVLICTRARGKPVVILCRTTASPPAGDAKSAAAGGGEGLP